MTWGCSQHEPQPYFSEHARIRTWNLLIRSYRRYHLFGIDAATSFKPLQKLCRSHSAVSILVCFCEALIVRTLLVSKRVWQGPTGLSCYLITVPLCLQLAWRSNFKGRGGVLLQPLLRRWKSSRISILLPILVNINTRSSGFSTRFCGFCKLRSQFQFKFVRWAWQGLAHHVGTRLCCVCTWFLIKFTMCCSRSLLQLCDGGNCLVCGFLRVSLTR